MKVDFSQIPGEYRHVGLIVGTAAFTWLFINSLFWNLLWSYVALRVLKFLFIISKAITVHFLTPEFDVSNLRDSWTVVTGGTDGIGRAYINELAKARGMRKFFLLGRNPAKLERVATELKKDFKAEVKTSVFDFDKDDLQTLPEELKTMDVGILVNFAGTASPKVGNLIEQDEGMASQILRVNLLSSVKMNELILPGMIQRNRGVIVNMSSMTGWRPLPYMSAYPASKAAIAFFSDTLSDEFRGSNVRIQCLVPLLVATKLASYDAHEANDLFVVPAENFAKQAVHALGTFELISGCIQHDFHVAFGSLISFFVFKKLFVPLVMLGIHKDRLDAYRKTHNQ